jgi:phosphate-selective porin OprO/OprP
MKSRDDNGIRLGLYENRIQPGRGNEYLELYSGLNVYLRGHDLKWQCGFRHIDLVDGGGDGGDYNGWSVSTGVRINW